MSVLSKYFSKNVNQASPVQIDYDRVVNYDENGNEFVTWVEVDYPTIQASHGVVEDWSLNALLAAGIDPSFPIHTGNPTRLDGFSEVMNAIDVINKELDASAAETPESE